MEDVLGGSTVGMISWKSDLSRRNDRPVSTPFLDCNRPKRDDATKRTETTMLRLCRKNAETRAASTRRPKRSSEIVETALRTERRRSVEDVLGGSTVGMVSFETRPQSRGDRPVSTPSFCSLHHPTKGRNDRSEMRRYDRAVGNHQRGMDCCGCGVRDRRYAEATKAVERGWEEAMEWREGRGRTTRDAQ